MSHAGMRASWPLAPLVGTLFWRVMIVETAHLEQESSIMGSKVDTAPENPLMAQLQNTIVWCFLVLCYFIYIYHKFCTYDTLFRERNYCKNIKLETIPHY